LIKAADMMIARRADTRARADFATWTMMAKLNGMSSLTPEAQALLDQYKGFLTEQPEADASEAVIQLIYKRYYAEMGGAGEAPVVKPKPAKASQPAASNVTAFKRPAADRSARTAGGSQARSRFPVALILIGLILVYAAYRFLFS
jgi:hypothetical protein